MTPNTISTITPQQHIEISYRTKFQKLLNDTNRRAIDSAFAKFMSFSYADARDTLWQILCFPDNVSLLDLSLSHHIPEDKTDKLISELRYQYSCINTGFLKPPIMSNGQVASAYSELEKISNSIIASVVYEVCSTHASFLASSDVERSIFLLKSPLENYFYGGLRNLGFNEPESSTLKPYHSKISALLQAIYETLEKSDKGYKSFGNLSQKLNEAGFELPYEFGTNEIHMGENLSEVHEDSPAQDSPAEDPPAEDFPAEDSPAEGFPAEDPPAEDSPVEDSPAEDPMEEQSFDSPETFSTEVTHQSLPSRITLNATSILSNRASFEALARNDDMNILIQIGHLGFDLNEVLVKLPQIRDFIFSLQVMEEANEVMKGANGVMKGANGVMKGANAVFKGANDEVFKGADEVFKAANEVFKSANEVFQRCEKRIRKCFEGT